MEGFTSNFSKKLEEREKEVEFLRKNLDEANAKIEANEVKYKEKIEALEEKKGRISEKNRKLTSENNTLKRENRDYEDKNRDLEMKANMANSNLNNLRTSFDRQLQEGIAEKERERENAFEEVITKQYRVIDELEAEIKELRSQLPAQKEAVPEKGEPKLKFELASAEKFTEGEFKERERLEEN
jgi:chromosome segregation ATPase